MWQCIPTVNAKWGLPISTSSWLDSYIIQGNFLIRFWIWWHLRWMWSVTCATSKMQNRTVPGGEGQMTWFKWDKLYIIRCEMTKRCWNWRGNLNIYPAKEVILQEFHTIRSFSFCYEYNSVQPSTWLNHVTCITTCTWLYNTQIKDFAHSAGWSRVMAHIHGITLSSDRALSPGTYQIFAPDII